MFTLLAGLLVQFGCGVPARARGKGETGVAGTNPNATHVQVAADPQSAKLQVPLGTVLPVRLNHGFSLKDARVGQSISGRMMQDVPLPNGTKIPQGAKVLGTIGSVSAAGPNAGGKVSFRFTEVETHHQRIGIVASLRAVASPMEVQFAQVAETPSGFGTPYAWVTTRLVGGGVKYGVGGPVTDKVGNTVGESTYDDVLVHVREQPGSPCRGALDAADCLQALWVFSSDACGVYGSTGVFIEDPSWPGRLPWRPKVAT